MRPLLNPSHGPLPHQEYTRLLSDLGCQSWQSRLADYFILFLGRFLKTNAFD